MNNRRSAVVRESAPELVVYNVDRNERAPLLETGTELFEDLWRRNSLGGFFVGRAAVRAFLPNGRGTLFFTGATRHHSEPAPRSPPSPRPRPASVHWPKT